MKMQELKNYSSEQLENLEHEMILRGNMTAVSAIVEFRKFYGKKVIVVRGRKVKKGTVGKVFWIGSTNYSKYGDPWGIYTSFRVGIRDDCGNVYWTSINNIELVA